MPRENCTEHTWQQKATKEKRIIALVSDCSHIVQTK
jgi:hypothetical protein